MWNNTRWMSAVVTVAAVGALNWGLVGALDFNLVTALFGETEHGAASSASRLVYGVVGLSGILAIVPSFMTRLAFLPRTVKP